MTEITVQSLENMKQTVERGKELLGKAEGKLENLHQQKSQINGQIQALGVEPENLAGEIEQLDGEMAELYQKAQGLIPQELLGR